MTTHITKTWFDGEKLVTQEIAESEVYKQEPVAWVREHELPLAPGDAFSWVETLVHKTPLYTTPPAAPVQPEQERECLRKAQAEAVMPLIGPLLDAWECSSESGRDEHPELDKQLRKINRAMEDATPPAAQRQWVGLTEQELSAIFQSCLTKLQAVISTEALLKEQEHMKIKQCPKCLKNRFNDSPVSFVWWSVMGHGYMCWHCFDKLKGKNT